MSPTPVVEVDPGGGPGVYAGVVAGGLDEGVGGGEDQLQDRGPVHAHLAALLCNQHVSNTATFLNNRIHLFEDLQWVKKIGKLKFSPIDGNESKKGYLFHH